ncbi:glutamic acid-rich protein-like isoform X2 [Phymastichus coffea]|uniref:glutamic acid-rich protein-like isoform X2 n=1 Tax=Phymastichus coffea TaxID=108790 RepID=UPI00273CB546|nr:glutamic acid-rich protein-like isoform X2 [Phymastichus coffea]
MVYESDFYTTRRPYSSSRPYVSSYSVTPILQGPFYLYDPVRVFVRTIPHIPYVGHRKLVSIVHTPVRIYHAGTYLPLKIHSRVRPSIIAAELNRIRYLTRPSSKSYLEDYLQSRDYIDFDDEAKDIRARTDKLLRKVHVYVPRPTLSDYEGETIPERLRSDDYVRRIINAKNTRKEIESLPWYSTPAKRDIGPGHLACIKYAGGRPQPKRKPYYTVSDLVPGDVKTDVKLMSYYSKNRKAAEDASPAPTIVDWNHEVEHEKKTSEQPIQQRNEHVVKSKVKPQVEVDVEVEVVQPEPEIETVEVKIPAKKKKEKKVTIEENNDDDMEAQYDEDGVKKVPDDDTIQKVQEYLNKKAAEKKLEEEKRAFEEAERKRIAAEKETARLAALMEEEAKRNAEMIEAEKREQERQEIIRKAEEARAEAERLKEDEKLFNEAVAQAIQDELERVAKEDEEAKLRQEEEEREDSKIAEVEGSSDIVAIEQHSEEHSDHANLSDQEIEAKPYELDHDEDTQVEEDEPEEQDIEDPFVNDEGAAIPADVDEPVPDTTRVKERGCAIDEPGFDWSSIDNEPEVEEACVDRQTPQIEEREEEAGSEQALEEVEISSRPEADDVRIEEAYEADEMQVEETQIIEETIEETHVEEEEEEEKEEEEEGEETKEEKTQAAEEESDNEKQEQVTEFEEAKSEDKTSHEVSEEEEREEEEE